MLETCCKNNFPRYFETAVGWIVECPYCGKQANGATKAEAMEEWNRKAVITDG